MVQSCRRTACFAPIRLPVLLAAALALAGCATSTERAAGAADPAVGQAARAVPEDDGLPPQVAPPVGIRRQPDDPLEPYSPNYGAPPPVPKATAGTRLSRLEEDALIAHAIAAHEMRRP